MNVLSRCRKRPLVERWTHRDTVVTVDELVGNRVPVECTDEIGEGGAHEFVFDPELLIDGLAAIARERPRMIVLTGWIELETAPPEQLVVISP